MGVLKVPIIGVLHHDSLASFRRTRSDKGKRRGKYAEKIVSYKGDRYRVSASKPSKNKNKKRYRVIENLKTGQKKTVHYGHSGYKNYGGSGGKYVHRSQKRRTNYLTRSAGIVDKQGNPTRDNPLSANRWAREDLW